MCDYSLQHVRSRPAKVGDKLTTRDFGTGTRGFAASEDAGVAVCVLPGTELSFAGEIASTPIGPLGWRKNVFNHRTAIFRQINKEKAMAHLYGRRALQAESDDLEKLVLRSVSGLLTEPLNFWPSWISARVRSHSRLAPKARWAT